MKKRLTALLIAILMIIALIPTTVFAEDTQEPGDTAITSAESEEPPSGESANAPASVGSPQLEAALLQHPPKPTPSPTPEPQPEITIETYYGDTKIDYEGGTIRCEKEGNRWHLDPHANDGFYFVKCEGDCYKLGYKYYVDIAQGKKVTAIFKCCTESFKKLKIVIDGEGTVSTDPAALFAIDGGGYYKKNTSVTLSATPSYGWSFQNFTGDTNSSTVKLCSDKTVTAHFIKRTYNVVFNPGLHGKLNGQTDPVTVPTLFGETPNPPSVTPFDGYVFTGWSPEIVPADQALAYTALYDCIPYTIRCDYDGGSADNPGTYTVESGEIRLNNPVRTGYLFAGWSGSGIEDGTMEVIIPAGSTGDRTYKALWTPVTYYVVYNKNGGSGGETADSTHVYDVASKLTKNGYYKEGHDFVGWAMTPEAAAPEYADEASVINLSSTEGGKVELFAVWKLRTFQVSFYQQDGTTQIGAAQTVGWNEAAALEKAPDVTGYTFDKWVLTGDDDAEPTSLANVKENIKAVASYVKNRYTVTFTDDQNKVIASQTVAYGEAATAPAPPVKLGYTFTGWDKPYSSITCDLTVTALYKINTYTVQFVDHDGKVLSTQTVNHGSAAAAPADPKRSGYSFAGWDKPYGSITGDLTVTAQYKINTYTVRFVDHDGKVLSTQTVNHGSAAAAPADPKRSGYTFIGWDKPYSAVTGDLIVTAQYKQVTTSGDESVPGTGDSGSQPFPWLWIAAAALLIGAIAAIVSTQLRRHKKTGDAV